MTVIQISALRRILVTCVCRQSVSVAWRTVNVLLVINTNGKKGMGGQRVTLSLAQPRWHRPQTCTKDHFHHLQQEINHYSPPPVNASDKEIVTLWKCRYTSKYDGFLMRTSLLDKESCFAMLVDRSCRWRKVFWKYTSHLKSTKTGHKSWKDPN